MLGESDDGLESDSSAYSVACIAMDVARLFAAGKAVFLNADCLPQANGVRPDSGQSSSAWKPTLFTEPMTAQSSDQAFGLSGQSLRRIVGTSVCNQDFRYECQSGPALRNHVEHVPFAHRLWWRRRRWRQSQSLAAEFQQWGDQR